MTFRFLQGCAAAILAWCCVVATSLAEDTPTLPARVAVPSMKTSIYVGSVRLETLDLVRSGEAWSGRYDARVFPWAFWSEHGEISIRLAATDLERLMNGETVEFTGDARNHRGKPREVTGRATPADHRGGQIKVRIRVDGIELVFNGTYSLDASV